MQPATPEQVRTELARRLGELEGLRSVFAYEPEMLGPLPCATLLTTWIQTEAESTGPRIDVTWNWHLRLYVGLSDWESAQRQLEELIPPVVALWRDDPTLNDLCEWWRLDDSGEPPMFNAADGWLRKALLVRAIVESVPD